MPAITGFISISMGSKERQVSVQPKPDCVCDNSPAALTEFRRIVLSHPEISTEEVALTEERIISAQLKFVSERKSFASNPEFGFIIHPRPGLELDDIARHFPALSLRYMSSEEIEDVFGLLPSAFELGGFYMSGKKEQIGKLICANITLEGYKRLGSRGKYYARNQAIEAARFAQRQGVKIIGLGETLASATYHGQTIEKLVPGIMVTTGHALTTYYIKETLLHAAREINLNIKDSSITIIGANGSIGTSTTTMLVGEVNRLTLVDKPQNTGVLKQKVQRLPTNSTQICVEEDLDRALWQADFVISAIANQDSDAIINTSQLRPGTIIIDDSQPPSISLETAQKADCLLLWPLVQAPEGIKRSFDYGLLPSSEWGCAAEVITIVLTSRYDLRTVGPVTTQRAEEVGKLSKKAGFTLAKPQSFGKEVTELEFKKLSNLRQNIPV